MYYRMNSSLKLQVVYRDVSSGNKYQLPAIYTRSGILISHVRYLAWYSEKSESWRERSVFSLRLLIDYIEAATGFWKTLGLLKNFARALEVGTIDYESSNDPLGLFWKGRNPADASVILFHVTHYTDFLAEQDGYDDKRINPFRRATSWEERLNWCAYYNKNSNVFLNHLSSPGEAKKEASRKRLIYLPQPLVVNNEKAKRFPEDKTEELIHNGFVVNGVPDYRSQAITMLMNYGGLRKCEVFHIFVSDITIHPIHKEEALVRVYHPRHGRSPDPRYRNREEYLLSETIYRPRDSYRWTERLHSGWKNPLLTSSDGYFEVIFSPTYKAKDFLNVWVKYLKYQRVEPRVFHPFAFTKDNGEPETRKNFQSKHGRAVRRIGLECKKELGTTEHGHRHAYGYRARSSGLTQVDLQKAMHHKSPNSCLVYIEPTSDDVRNEMRKHEK